MHPSLFAGSLGGLDVAAGSVAAWVSCRPRAAFCGSEGGGKKEVERDRHFAGQEAGRKKEGREERHLVLVAGVGHNFAATSVHK